MSRLRLAQAVLDVDDFVVLGQISLHTIDLNDGAAGFSYWVLPRARGGRIEINHSTENPASCRVAERAGYLAVCVKRSEALHADGWHDMHQHARIATDPDVTHRS